MGWARVCWTRLQKKRTEELNSRTVKAESEAFEAKTEVIEMNQKWRKDIALLERTNEALKVRNEALGGNRFCITSLRQCSGPWLRDLKGLNICGRFKQEM